MPATSEPGYYLGRRFDPEQLRLSTDKMRLGSDFVMSPYDFLTHAIILGMTGSGKTILGKIIVEEAALQGIPAILIDPKGDLASMKLVFPTLSSDEFLPWVETRKRKSKQKTAHELAEQFKHQFELFNLPQDRLKEFREKTNIVVLTPRSSTGIPVAISSLPHPPPNVNTLLEVEPETVLDLIDAVVRSLIMRLYPMDPPGKRRTEEKFLNDLVRYAWENEVPLHGIEGLATLIDLVDNPPMKKIGIMSVDRYFPPKDRHELAVNINNLLIGVEQLWHMGVPLDIDVLLETYSQDDKTPVIIFDLSEISSFEDTIFIVSRIAYSIYEWMRRKGGAGDPRLLFYIDEIGGGGGKTAFFPIHPFNPPSKPPLMLLIKQARAFGVCCIFSTQNPGDIDYKGLSNCGTWIVGRLSTARDRKKALQGLGDIKLFGTSIDRRSLEKHIAMLETGEFVCKTQQGELEFFKERWLMSYHKTMTGKDIRRITAARDRKSATDKQPQYLSETKRRFLPLRYPTSLKVLQKHFDKHLSFQIEKSGCNYLPLLSFHVDTGIRMKHSFLKNEVVVDLQYGPFLVPLFEEKADTAYVADTLGLPKLSMRDLLDKSEDDRIPLIARKLPIQEAFNQVTENLQTQVRQDVMCSIAKQIEQEQREKIDDENLTFQPELDELDYKIQTSNDRIVDLRNQIQQLQAEVWNFESEKASRLREGISTIMVSKSIASRQRQLRHCETNITREQTKLKNYNRQKTRIQERKQRRITTLTNQFNKVQTALFDRIDFKLLFDDPMETFIPICTTELTVKNREVEPTLTLQWNGYNGARITPHCCAECGGLIEKTDLLTFCYLCPKLLCKQHAITCNECGKTVCTAHQWTCETCATTFCLEEPKHFCSIGHHHFCDDCRVTCVTCAETICKQHALTCRVCGNTICYSGDHYTRCAICDTAICNSCIVECTGCEKPLCAEHSLSCPNCGKTICKACLRMERKFLGLSKKQKCVNCL